MSLCKDITTKHNTLENFYQPYQRVRSLFLIAEHLGINDHNVKPFKRSILALPSDGYDPSLIYSIENEMLVTDPGVHWNDIDGLNDTKGLLQETVVLPFPMPDFFQCICRPWKGILMVGRSYWNWKDGSGQSHHHRIQNPVLQSVGVDPHIQTCITVTHRKKLVKVLFEMAKFHALSTIFMWQ